MGRGKSECFHNFLSRHRGLEVADTVFLFYIGKLAAYLLEIGQETTYLFRILARDISFAKFHQVIYIVTRIKQQTAYSGIGHLIVRQGDRAHVQADHLLDIFHLLVHRQFHLAEDTGNHLLPYKIMIVERPS